MTKSNWIRCDSYYPQAECDEIIDRDDEDARIDDKILCESCRYHKERDAQASSLFTQEFDLSGEGYR